MLHFLLCSAWLAGVTTAASAEGEAANPQAHATQGIHQMLSAIDGYDDLTERDFRPWAAPESTAEGAYPPHGITTNDALLSVSSIEDLTGAVLVKSRIIDNYGKRSEGSERKTQGSVESRGKSVNGEAHGSQRIKGWLAASTQLPDSRDNKSNSFSKSGESSRNTGNSTGNAGDRSRNTEDRSRNITKLLITFVEPISQTRAAASLNRPSVNKLPVLKIEADDSDLSIKYESTENLDGENIKYALLRSTRLPDYTRLGEISKNKGVANKRVDKNRVDSDVISVRGALPPESDPNVIHLSQEINTEIVATAVTLRTVTATVTKTAVLTSTTTVEVKPTLSDDTTSTIAMSWPTRGTMLSRHLTAASTKIAPTFTVTLTKTAEPSQEVTATASLDVNPSLAENELEPTSPDFFLPIILRDQVQASTPTQVEEQTNKISAISDEALDTLRNITKLLYLTNKTSNLGSTNETQIDLIQMLKNMTGSMKSNSTGLRQTLKTPEDVTAALKSILTKLLEHKRLMHIPAVPNRHDAPSLIGNSNMETTTEKNIASILTNRNTNLAVWPSNPVNPLALLQNRNPPQIDEKNISLILTHHNTNLDVWPSNKRNDSSVSLSTNIKATPIRGTNGSSIQSHSNTSEGAPSTDGQGTNVTQADSDGGLSLLVNRHAVSPPAGGGDVMDDDDPYSNVTATTSDPFGCRRTNVEYPLAIQYRDLRARMDTGSLLLVDVRNASDLVATGRLPWSYNLPQARPNLAVPQLEKAFKLPSATFQKRYGFPKPSGTSPHVVFTGSPGGLLLTAWNVLQQFGYCNVRLYYGSHKDWSKRGGSLIPFYIGGGDDEERESDGISRKPNTQSNRDEDEEHSLSLLNNKNIPSLFELLLKPVNGSRQITDSLWDAQIPTGSALRDMQGNDGSRVLEGSFPDDAGNHSLDSGRRTNAHHQSQPRFEPTEDWKRSLSEHGSNGNSATHRQKAVIEEAAG